MDIDKLREVSKVTISDHSSIYEIWKSPKMDTQISGDDVSNTLNDEFVQYVDTTEKYMSIDTTVRWLGGSTNFARLFDVIVLYNKNDELITITAANVTRHNENRTFNYEGCLTDGVIFWNFLKTLNTFKKAPWYVRDYVVAKLFAKRISISEIL